jgi:beta-glucosidase-like glycosyl hydrolase
MTLDEKIKEERINESTKRILDVKVDRGIIK